MPDEAKSPTEFLKEFYAEAARESLDRGLVSIPRQSGKSAAVSANSVPYTADGVVKRSPSDRSFTIAGMKVAEEEFYNVHKALGGDQQTTVDHFLKVAHQQRSLANYYGGSQQRHGSSPFNPSGRRRMGRSLLMDRFLNMERREQDVVELLAMRMRDTYMPHHQGQQMEPWRAMHPERQIKWIEMAVVAIRELDKLGLMRNA